MGEWRGGVQRWISLHNIFFCDIFSNRTRPWRCFLAPVLLGIPLKYPIYTSYFKINWFGSKLPIDFLLIGTLVWSNLCTDCQLADLEETWCLYLSRYFLSKLKKLLCIIYLILYRNFITLLLFILVIMYVILKMW